MLPVAPPAKAGFYLMLPVPSAGLAIDLGSGCEQMAEALAARFRQVMVVERKPGLEVPANAKDADLVIADGVLASMVAHNDARRAKGVQLAFLRSIRKALRPGGRLGLAVDNRFSYERSGRVRGTYSATGYYRLLRSAGFVNVDIRAALPTYREPTTVIALSNPGAIRAALCPSTAAKARLLDFYSTLGIVGHVVPSFYIVAERP